MDSNQPLRTARTCCLVLCNAALAEQAMSVYVCQELATGNTEGAILHAGISISAERPFLDVSGFAEGNPTYRNKIPCREQSA